MGDLVPRQPEIEELAEKGILAAFHGDLDIYAIEKKLKDLTQEEIEPNHVFAGGVYIREIIIPKGTLIIGKRHRHATCNILMRGELSLYVGGGEPPARIKGPLLFESPPLAKKMAYCHEEAVFMNIHPTELTDVDEIEKVFIIPEEEYLLKSEGEKPCLGES